MTAMSPEASNPTPFIGNLIAQLDEQTLIMSGGFDRLEAFQEVVSHGEAVLPALLHDMEEPNWWKLQAVWTIAYNIGNTIHFPEESRGKYRDVCKIVATWGDFNGYTGKTA